MAADETDTLLGSLERQRVSLPGSARGLDAAGMQATVGASTTTLGELLKLREAVDGSSARPPR